MVKSKKNNKKQKQPKTQHIHRRLRRVCTFVPSSSALCIRKPRQKKEEFPKMGNLKKNLNDFAQDRTGDVLRVKQMP